MRQATGSDDFHPSERRTVSIDNKMGDSEPVPVPAPKPKVERLPCLQYLAMPVQRPLPVLEKPMFPRLTEKIINVTYNYLPGASPPCYDAVWKEPSAAKFAEDVHPETPDSPDSAQRVASTERPNSTVVVRPDIEENFSKPSPIKLNFDDVAPEEERPRTTSRPRSLTRDETADSAVETKEQSPGLVGSGRLSSIRRSLSRRLSSKSAGGGEETMVVSFQLTPNDDPESSPGRSSRTEMTPERNRSLSRRSSSSGENAMPVHPTSPPEDVIDVSKTPSDEERHRRLSFRPTMENKVDTEQATTPVDHLETRSASSGSRSGPEAPLLRMSWSRSSLPQTTLQDRPMSFQLDSPSTPRRDSSRPASFGPREASSLPEQTRPASFGPREANSIPEQTHVVHSPVMRYKESTLGVVIRLILVLVFSGLLLLALMHDGYYPLTENGRPDTFGFRATFWPGPALRPKTSLACGSDGVECRPFSTSDTWFGGHCLPRAFTRANINFIVRGGGGSEPVYTADSNICFAAIHAGVISELQGGCFEVRFRGPQDSFTGIDRNGIQSTDFGWFPRSVEFRKVQNPAYCSDTRWSGDLIVAIGFVCLAMLWRVDGYWLNHIAAQWGFYFAGMSNLKASGDFWPVINELSNKEFTLIPMCFFLFHFFGRPGFCPDPKRFPLDALLFFCTFFWIFTHLQDFEDSFNANFTFTAKSLSNVSIGSVVILVILAVIAVPLAILQTRVLFRAGLIKYYLVVLGALVLYLATIALAEPGMFSYHLHHYFIGFLLCVCGRGQKRYSIMIQAIGLALFVEGLALYDTDPFFDQRFSPKVGYEVGDGYKHIVQSPVFTRVELFMNETPPRVVLEWTLPSALVVNWTCSEEVVDLVPGIMRAPSGSNSRRQRRLEQQAMEASRPRDPKFFFADVPAEETEDEHAPQDLIVVAQPSILDPDISPSQYLPEDFDFYVARNGISFPGVFHGTFNLSIPFAPGHESSNLLTVFNPLVFTVTMTGDSPSSFRLPLPFPALDNTTLEPLAYHALDANFCDRMQGIYSKLKHLEDYELQIGSVWWNDGT